MSIGYRRHTHNLPDVVYIVLHESDRRLLPIMSGELDCYHYMCSGEDSEMTIAEIRELVQYVTNAHGETTGVLVPLKVWELLKK
ncbi:hypothetical protein [Microseira wollei]|nr:hypothetical protein [Microseira wollei]